MNIRIVFFISFAVVSLASNSQYNKNRFKKGLVNYFFSDYPELASKMKTKSKSKLNDVIGFVNEYNAWYQEQKKKMQQ